MTDLSTSEMQRLADAAAKKAVAEVFTKLGVDIDDPIAAQMDFAHLRKQRTASEEIGKLALRTVLGAIILGGISTLWLGVRALILKS